MRDNSGRISSVTTKKNAAAAQVTVASAFLRQPLTNLVQSFSYGNGLNEWNTFTLDNAIDVIGVYDGATTVINRAHTRTDNLNLTDVLDNVATANNASFGYTPSNRLNLGNGPWGARSWAYDGVGNRTQEVATPPGGSATTDVYAYPVGSNRLTTVTRRAESARLRRDAPRPCARSPMTAPATS